MMRAPGGEKTHPHTGWTFESIYSENHYAKNGGGMGATSSGS